MSFTMLRSINDLCLSHADGKIYFFYQTTIQNQKGFYTGKKRKSRTIVGDYYTLKHNRVLKN